jgi:protein involved in polysaccharide export with SLBB domain
MLGVVSIVCSAQQSGPAGALQALGGLSPEQQQALLQRATGTAAAGTNAQGATGATQPGRSNQAASGSRNSNAGAGAGPLQARLIPVFEPDDSVLIDINLPGEKPVAQQAADLYAQELNTAALQLLSAGQPLSAQALAAQANNQLINRGVVPATAANAAQQAPPGNGTVSSGSSAPANANQANAANGGAPQANGADPLRAAKRELLKVLRAHNPYKLDRDGVLQLPGFRDIELAGLSEAEATRRVAAEPALQDFEIRVIRLPVEKRGTEALQPYGYDLFANGQQGMAPVSTAPVPDDYVVGPGDAIEVQLYGNQNYTLELTVSRDGRVNFPQLGPISVGGQRYSAVKHELESRVAKQMIGVRAGVSMGETRTINVFVLGEAVFPGSYSVTGLATVTTALFAAGGVKPQGSLRHIQVRRAGTLVREFDLYDLLMRGDSTNDVKLQPGDVVMIPAVGPTASADGEVQRPAIYELKGVTSVAGLVEMAGGLTPEADSGSAALVHVNEQRQRVVVDVAPGAAVARAQLVGNGDAMRVARLKPTIDSGVMLQGYVYRPGNYAWREGLRLADVISSIDELKPHADQGYVLIRRVLTPGRRIAVLSADLAAALRDPASPANVLLQPRDTLTVFDLQTGRDRIIEPLMQELNLQGSLARPTEVVHVDGRVKVPGDYPLESGMHVSDLIRAGGNLESSAYGGHAELARYAVENGAQRRTEIISIDLGAVARGDPAADIELKAFDQLSIKEISGWNEQNQITLTGEVRFPGTYTIKHNETLRSVIERAGGLTDLAFPEGSVFVREDLRVREQQQLDRLADRMQSDIASMSLMAARASQSGATAAYSVGQSLLAQLQSTKAVGRLVIDLNAAIQAPPGGAYDIVIRSGDQLIVPKQRQDVMVLGEVQSPSSHLYQSDLSRDEYIEQSGGTTRQADRDKIYVVRADGSVVANHHSWLIRSSGGDIRPGDSIVVPLDTERLPRLPMWQSITQILYNTAIAAAAIHSF